MGKGFGLWFAFVAALMVASIGFSGWCTYKMVTWITSGQAAQQVHTATH